MKDFFFLFSSEKIITRYRRIGYKLNVMRQSACLVFKPIMVDNYADFFLLHAIGSGVRLYDCPHLKLFILVGWGRGVLSVAWPTGVQLVYFSFAPELVSYLATRDLYRRSLTCNRIRW